MTTTDTTTPARNYPLPQPQNDPRFTFGLLHEVAKTIEAHGYPPLTGRDVVELNVALFGLLYTPDTDPDTDTDETDHAAITRGAQTDAAVEATGHLPGFFDANGCPYCPCPTDLHTIGPGCVLCDCTWEARR